ncbi:MAG: hypothetical protein U0163_19925 [Gemmatimonadaceae bacterium]
MGVDEAVEDHASVPPACTILRRRVAHLMRHRRFAQTDELGEVGVAEFRERERVDDPRAGWVGQAPEHARNATRKIHRKEMLADHLHGFRIVLVVGW